MKEQIVGKCQAQVSIVAFGGGVFSVTVSRKGEIKKLTDCNWGDVQRVLREVEPTTAVAAMALGAGLGGLGAQAINQFASISSAGQNCAALGVEKTASATAQERRRECVRLAIQAGAGPREIIEVASRLEEWTLRRDR